MQARKIQAIEKLEEQTGIAPENHKQSLMSRLADKIRALTGDAIIDAQGNHHSEGNGEFVSQGSDTISNGISENGCGGEIMVTSQEEKQNKIDSIKIDFDADVNELPELNAEDLEALGKPNKPVVLKKNVIEKNEGSHPDLSREEYEQIIGNALYKNDAIYEGNRKDRPYFQFVSRMDAKGGVTVLLEVEENNENYEIVNFYRVRNKTMRKLEGRHKVK